MVRYLLNFKTITDVAVRTLILTLAISLLAAVATDHSYKIFLPEVHALVGGKAFLIAFSLGILLGMPIIGVFFSAGLEINRLNSKLETLAQADPLTGLMNRRKFLETVSTFRAPDSQELVMRSRGAMLIIDADFFKRINDDYGHQAGDEALVFIANALRQSVRDDDAVARLGGEEFGVFLHETDERTAFEVAERIRSTICVLPVDIMGQPVSISVSIGGTQALRAQSLSDCMRNADTLLYAAKQAGRNKTLFAGPAHIAPFADMSPLDRRERLNARA
jgi:diguanylate cyclase